MVTPAQNSNTIPRILENTVLPIGMTGGGYLASHYVTTLTHVAGLGVGFSSFILGKFLGAVLEGIFKPKAPWAKRTVKVLSYASGIGASVGLTATFGATTTMAVTAGVTAIGLIAFLIAAVVSLIFVGKLIKEVVNTVNNK